MNFGTPQEMIDEECNYLDSLKKDLEKINASKMAESIKTNQQFAKLKKLESRINLKYSRSRHPESFLENNGYLFNTWCKYMVKLRGWDEYKYVNGKDITKAGWIEYCNKHNLSTDYNFGDILA